MDMRDLAAHSLSLIIQAQKVEKLGDSGRHFLNWVMEGNEYNLSVRCKSTVLLHLMKINDLA
jgi:hypothetical protein